MRYRLLASLVVAAAVLTPATAAGAAPLSASVGNGAQFPARTLVVSAPGGRPLTSATVHVQENGTAVGGIAVTPLSTANRGDFGVILVIDTSESMKGPPLRQAVIAARTLAGERSGNQELGIIEFNHSSTVVLPLTSDPNEITSALARAPEMGVGTHIYDTTLQAIEQLHDARVVAGTVIVLSDGQDVGSHADQQAVAAVAAADHVRVYTIGVSDPSFTPSTLATLATATSGSYTESSAGGLRTVFTRIESQLTSRYVVRYRSSQPYGSRVKVSLGVDGIPGSWHGSYSAPPAAPLAAAPSSHRPSDSFWASTLALVLVALVCASLLVAGLFIHLVPRSRKHALRRRIGEFTATESHEPAPVQIRSVHLAERVENWLSRFAWWPKFKEDVDVAGIQRGPAELVLMMALGTLTTGILISLLVGSPLMALPILLIGPVLLSGGVRQRANRQRRAFADELPGHLEAIGSAMRAGHSVFASIAAMAEDATDPTRREFERAVADERLGVPPDAALRPVARRMRSSDIDQLALVATLNQRTGGNMAEVLDVIADAARERAELRRELNALTAQARMSRGVVTALPVGLLALLTMINRNYVSPLFTTTAGIFALSVATGLVVTGWFVMRALVPSEE
jgi:tight adherence protein B